MCLTQKMDVPTTAPTHSQTLTDYDRANMPIYLFVFDARKAGYGWRYIADQLWGETQPKNAKKLIMEIARRARWMTETGYQLLLADSATPRDEALDELVASGAMTADERAFLDSPEGERFWPRAKH